MGVDAVQEFIRITQISNVFKMASQQLLLSWILIAQEYSGNLLGDLQTIFNNFVESGQIWTLLIGFVLGYLFRNLTAY